MSAPGREGDTEPGAEPVVGFPSGKAHASATPAARGGLRPLGLLTAAACSTAIRWLRSYAWTAERELLGDRVA
jgi:hypothetical protein